MREIKVGEKYSTVGGHLVVITAVHTDSRLFPITGDILQPDGVTVLTTTTFKLDGKYNASGTHKYDLIIGEVKKVATGHQCRCPRENFQYIGGGCKGCECGGI